MTGETTTSRALEDGRAAKAHNIYTQQFEHSTIADKSSEFPVFDYAELTLGPVLGKGGFGVVSEIRSFDVTSMVLPTSVRVGVGGENEESLPVAVGTEGEGPSTRTTWRTLDAKEIQGRHFIAEHCIRDGTDARYAIKMLKPELTGETLIKGLADMAVETHILSAIEHPNIVKLRATASQLRYDPYYFIVMDRLYDTLEKRIGTWAETMATLQPPKPPKPTPVIARRQSATPPKRRSSTGNALLGLCLGRGDPNVVVEEPLSERQEEEPEEEAPAERESLEEKKKRTDALNKLLEARLVAAFDLAAAIQYLHDRSIIYRDIKPENAAFDVRGDVKLFDFGTSKELPKQNAKRDLTFKLTGVTGSLPYMAPEVAKTEPYNHKCDIFSFAIMLWRIMALTMPFAEYESDLHRFFDEVHCGPNNRPPIPATWPLPVQICLKRGWCQNPQERMEMEQIVNILKKEIVRVRKGDSTGLQHNRRRSTFVFRR